MGGESDETGDPRHKPDSISSSPVLSNPTGMPVCLRLSPQQGDGMPRDQPGLESNVMLARGETACGYFNSIFRYGVIYPLLRTMVGEGEAPGAFRGSRLYIATGSRPHPLRGSPIFCLTRCNTIQSVWCREGVDLSIMGESWEFVMGEAEKEIG